ncbi:beta-lactamase/transpeptidase-like protein [Nemania sp. NC0429]|nr:beta-lactamase/transpeptidase-like protein [Nemania sp. NC0429]
MASNRDEIIARLEAAMSKIESVRKLCKAPSISVGVLHQGEVVFRRSVSLRDIEANLEANSDTAYQIGSCSKLFTSTALGLLSNGHPIWEDKVQDHLPDFDPIQDPVSERQPLSWTYAVTPRVLLMVTLNSWVQEALWL